MKHLKPNTRINVVGDAYIENDSLKHIVLYTENNRQIVYRHISILNEEIKDKITKYNHKQIFIEGILHRYPSKRLLSELEISDFIVMIN